MHATKIKMVAPYATESPSRTSSGYIEKVATTDIQPTKRGSSATRKESGVSGMRKDFSCTYKGEGGGGERLWV